MRVTLCISALACFVFAEARADDTVIDLGGLRQAKASLAVSPDDYVIKVRMLPVKVFDDATNARLNRDKARELALQALAKHLSKEKSVEFAVSGAQVENTGSDGSFYTLALRVPRKGVLLVRSGEEPPVKTPAAAKVERVSFTSELFTRKRDYLRTIAQLADSLKAELQSAEEKNEDADSFYRALADVEERGLRNFDRLDKEIGADSLLLAIEKKELGDALKKQQDRLLSNLKLSAARMLEKSKGKK